MESREAKVSGRIASWRLAGLMALGALVSAGPGLAYGQQDALIVEKSGAVRVTTTLSVANVASAGEFLGKGAVPKGVILMWYGDPLKEKPPEGWVLCDGNNGTPDLRGRFVVGYHPADRDYSNIRGPGGGTASNTITLSDLGDHTHNVATVPISAVAAHTHSIGNHYHRWMGGATTDAGSGATSAANPAPSIVGYGLKQGSSPTGGVVQARPVSKQLDNRPPYKVLAYIMYVGK